MIWDKPRVLQAIKKRQRAGKALSYNALAQAEQALVSAAAYHFGSYRKAVEKAGIDYGQVLRRPRWNRQRIVALIKSARKKGADLNWSAVTRRRDELGKAAFASLQSRLFGRWDRALAAAGLGSAQVSRYRKWTNHTIVAELKNRRKSRRPLNSGAIQAADPGLHAAAVRHFGSYDAALRAAHVNPVGVRRRRGKKNY